MKHGLLLSSALTLAAAAPTISSAQEVERFDNDGEVIIVTASPLGRTINESIVGVSVLEGDELSRRITNTIGETLRREPGVSSSYFGPGASRPVIRGLGGDRIRVLDAGIGSIDASATSPDHAVAVEPATAERIEIVRGAAMLLYGSSAAGGVVNVLSGKIPTEVPEDAIDGGLRVGGSTVDDGVEAAGGFDLLLGKYDAGALVFHGEGFYREAEEYDIPGFAESERLRAAEEAEEEDEDHDDDDDHEHEEEEEVFGVVENTAVKTVGGSAGLSWIFDSGFIGFSATAMDTKYGVPGEHGHHHHEDEEDEDHEEEHEEEHGEEEGGVTIDLKQRRYDLNGEIGLNFGIFDKAKFRVGYADYEHKEFEGEGEIGTVFTNEGWEGRLEIVETPFAAFGGELGGAFGIQYRESEFSAIGEEAFVPPTDTNQFGAFFVKEFENGPLRLDLSGRYENTNHETQDGTLERSFDGFSVSAGAGYSINDNINIGVQGFRTERAPSTTELFSDGPHLATSQFEVGNPDLDEEVAVGVEGAFRYNYKRHSFVVNGFYTSYDGFIYERETGDEEDELPVFEFTAADADFYGFEAKAEVELFRAAQFDIHADAGVDYVRAKATNGGGDLPRIPPLTGLLGVEARSSFVDFRAELDIAAEQDKFAEFELPTDGYEVVNLFVTVRPFATAKGISLNAAVENVTDEEVRLHTSFLKDVAPLPGRNFKFSLQGKF